jgi:hypothetical protein
MITDQELDTKIWCPKLRGDFENFSWYPACAQIKIDGEYEIIDTKYETTINKYGKTRTDFPALNEIITKLHGPHRLIAELYWGDGKNNALYKLLENKESDDLKLFVHDIQLPYATAFERLSFLKDKGLTQFTVVENKQEALDFFNETVKAGYEGIVLKPSASKIQEANQWVKVKLEDETEMEVTKIYESEEKVDLKFEGKIVGCKASTALKSKLRVGQTVLVKHNGFTKNSVRHPVIINKEVSNGS